MKSSFIIIFFIGLFSDDLPDKVVMRKLFEKTFYNRESSGELLRYIEQKRSTPLSLGYKGATKMVKAQFGLNLYARYNNFISGMNDLERAILQDEQNVELRFIRFCCQENSPWFLNYKNSLESDKKYLLNLLNQNLVTEMNLRSNIITVLVNSSVCNNDEKQFLLSLQ